MERRRSTRDGLACQHGARRRRDEEMRSIDEAEAALSDCGGGEQQAIDCTSADNGRWSELSCLTGMARGGELNSEAIQTTTTLERASAESRLRTEMHRLDLTRPRAYPAMMVPPRLTVPRHSGPSISA